MDVSVVICTHNSKPRLVRCLEHLSKQIAPKLLKWEIIVCDYQSVDGTSEVVDNFMLKHNDIDVKFIKIAEPGKTPALAKGFDEALAEAICIVDDDNLVDDNYVVTAHRILSAHPEIGVIGAQGFPSFEKKSCPPVWFQHFKGIFAVGHQHTRRGLVEGNRYFFWGAGSVFRRSAWKKALQMGFTPILNPSRGKEGDAFVKGFTGGEDPEMCFAIQLAGFKLWYEPNLKYHHLIPEKRMTETFIFDTTKNVHVVEPYLRLFASFVIPDTGFRNKLKILIWRNWYLQFFFIVISSARNLILSFFSDLRIIRLKFVITSMMSQIIGLWNLRDRFNALKSNFEKFQQK